MEYYIDTSLHQFFIYNGFKTERKSMSYQEKENRKIMSVQRVGWSVGISSAMNKSQYSITSDSSDKFSCLTC